MLASSAVGATPWQPPSCGAASIMTTLVLTAINASLLEQRPAEHCVREDEYDFVVVGGGSAGCVLAGRLSENPAWSVLLLEAGGEEPEVTKVPGFYYDVNASPLNWGLTSERQENGACENGCAISRGKVLGGGSSTNGMFYVRGSRYDFSYWNASGWTYEAALPFFKKSEDNRDPDIASDATYHSTGGPLSVQRMPYRDQNLDIFAEGFGELGLPTVDINGETQLGKSVLQMTMAGGRRDSTNSAYLDPVRGGRENLRVETLAHVTKVLVDSSTKRASGVEYLDRTGTRRTVCARREVVVSAGTLGSPQLLLLSGIGPEDQLREHNIPIVLDLPAVGENLQDHVWASGVSYRLNGTATEPADLQQRLQDLLGYKELREGPLSGYGVSQLAAFQRVGAQPRDDPRPYVQYTFTVQSAQPAEERRRDSAACAPGETSIDYYSSVSVSPFLLHPRSRGRVLLDSADPLRPPRVQLNLLDDEQDVRVLAEALRWAAKLANTTAVLRAGITLEPPNGPAAPEECRQFDVEDDALWECLARVNAGSGIHYVGSCGIGGVVDERLVVKGVHGLRVADGSVIPLSPSGNTNAPVIMVAERAACIIRKDNDPAYSPPPGETC